MIKHKECEECGNNTTVTLEVKGMDYHEDKDDIEDHSLCNDHLNNIDWTMIKSITILETGARKELSMFDIPNDFLLPNGIIIAK